MAKPDHYAVLGLTREATQDEIKRAYRRLALECHPDRFPGDADAEARFRRVSAAYAVLGDVDQRRNYDRARLLPDRVSIEEGTAFPSARDLFNNVFGDVFGQRRERRRRGSDLRYTLTVDFAEAVLGSTHQIEFEAQGLCSSCAGEGTAPGGRPAELCPSCEGRGELKTGGLFSRRSVCGRCNGMGMIQLDPCSSCRGSGRRREQRSFTVRLPPGTEGGAERVLRGQGEPGRFGGEAGDLRVTVNVRPHPFLRREGLDILIDYPATYPELSLGAKIEVPTVDGWVRVDLPAGIEVGKRLRLRKRGVPDGRGERGDQYVVVTLEVPRAPSGRQREAVEGLITALEADPDSTPRRQALRRAAEAASERSD